MWKEIILYQFRFYCVMSIIIKLKRKVGVFLSNSPISLLLNKINLCVFHWEERAHFIKGGDEEPEKNFLVIRPFGETQGLLSTYFYVLNYIKWAREKNYIPFIDFETKRCQYYTGRNINGSSNAWEYYFEQPENLTKEEVYKKKNILLSGWNLGKKYKVQQIPKTVEAMQSCDIKYLASSQINIKPYIYEIVEEKYNKMFGGRVLGVFMRGTDYVKLKPKGHAVQPTINEMMLKIEEYIGKYDIQKIFVVTEDYSYYRILKDTYPDKVFSSDDYFIKGYDSKDYIEAYFENDPYERGVNYLVRVLLLNKCDYLIAGITNGSLVSCCLRKQDFKDEYWFELGDY